MTGFRRQVIDQLARHVLSLIVAAALGAIPLAGPALSTLHNPAASALPARDPTLVPGTPCTVGVRACLSLGEQRAWLLDGDKVIHGPFDVISGGLGQETPTGDFTVLWKNRDHKSSEHQTPEGLPSPMPFAVFFAPGGIAFHEGDLDRPSAGCVRMARADAERTFNTLRVGDKVQVHGG